MVNLLQSFTAGIFLVCRTRGRNDFEIFVTHHCDSPDNVCDYDNVCSGKKCIVLLILPDR